MPQYNSLQNRNLYFPPFQFLESLYKHRSYYHNISHILRVWVYSLLILQEYQSLHSNSILMAALLHDSGRKRDFWDKNHGYSSGKVVKEYLPLITARFSSAQIDDIAILCAKHNEDDFPNMSLELSILKDADALDRIRLPRGKLDVKRLRTKASHKLINFAEDFYKDWKSLEKIYSEPLQVLRYCTQKHNIYNLLPIDIKEQMLLARSKDIDRNLKLSIELIQKALDIKRSISNKLNSNSLLISDLIQVDIYLNGLENKNISSLFIKNLLIEEIKYILLPVLRLVLLDHTYARQFRLKAIQLFKNVLKEKSNYMYPQDENILFSTSALSRNPATIILFNALSKNLLKYSRYKKLVLLYKISNNDYHNIVNQSFNPSSQISTDDSILMPTKGDIHDNPFLWIEIADQYIRKAQLFLFKGQIAEVNKYLQISLDLIKNILDTDECPNYIYNQTIKKFLYILDIAKRCSAQNLIQEIADIWQQPLNYVKIFPKFKHGKIAYNANLFNLYCPYDKNAKEIEKNQLLLFKKLHKYNAEMDSVLECYILPLISSKYFPQFKTSTLKYFTKNNSNLALKEKLSKWTHILQSSKSSSKPYSHIIKYVNDESEGNIDKILNRLKIDLDKKSLFINKGEDLKIIMNITDLDILTNIINNNSSFLSVWNILGIEKIKKNHKIASQILRYSYAERTAYRDSVQRQMNIRFPNLIPDHGIYGSFEYLGRLIKTSKENPGESIRNQIVHYPMYTFMRKNYGNITIVFKDHVKKKSAFVFLDSFWKFRNLYVDYKHAYILKNILNSELVKIAINTNPFCLTSAYIETIIFGKITIKDIELIIIPKDIARKNIKKARAIKKIYPHIKFIKN